MSFYPSNRTRVLTLLLILCTFRGLAQTQWERLEPTLKDSSEKATLNFYINACKSVFVGNRTLSLNYAQKAYAISEKNSAYILEFGDINNMMGVISMYNEHFDKAESYLKKTLEIGRQQHSELLQVKALANLALTSSRRGDYQKAILQNLELMPILEKKNDEVGMANLYANISNAYYYIDQWKPAEQYQKKALALFRKLDYEPGISNAFNTLANIAIEVKQYQQALDYFALSLALKKKVGDSTGIAGIYLNLNDVYAKLGRYAEGFASMQKAEVIYKALKEEQQLAKVYVNMGAYYSHTNDYVRSAEYEKKAIALARKSSDPYVLGTVYSNISKTYEHLHSLDTALAFSRKALTTKDSLINTTIQEQIKEIETKYETEKKERIIGAQQVELSRKQVELKERQLALLRKDYALAAAGLLLLALIATGLLFYRRAKARQKARLQEAIIVQQQLASRAVLDAEEKERVRIAKDLHDGVGQMMSVARMNLSSIESNWTLQTGEKIQLENVIALVDESCREVRSVSHNLMPNALLKAGLGAAIREFVDKIDSHAIAIDLYSEGLKERLDPTTETVLYRVIQECVNNVIRHSGASRLDISLLREADAISITVEDNGRGFVLEERKNAGGIGLSNMATRIAYLKGTIEWDSTPGKGTVVAIHVPLGKIA